MISTLTHGFSAEKLVAALLPIVGVVLVFSGLGVCLLSQAAVQEHRLVYGSTRWTYWLSWLEQALLW